VENYNLNLLTERLGEIWETLRISIKPYPSCHFTHSFIDCALHLEKELDIKWQDTKRVECRISPRQASIICEPIEKKRKVTTSYGARFSLPYTIAVALVEGKVGLKQFAERCLNDKRIITTASIAGYIKDETLLKETEHFPGDVTIEMKNGKRYRFSQKFERGSRENPLQKNEIKDKFKANMAEAGMDDEKRIEDISNIVQNLEEVTSIGELTALLR